MAGKAGTPLTYLWATLTQGSSDAFVQATILTGLNAAGSKIAYRIREILIEQVTNPATTSGCEVEYSLTVKSMAAMPVLTEQSLLWKWRRLWIMATSGGGFAPKVVREKYDELDNLIFASTYIYAQLDSASVGAAVTAYMRIGVEEVTIGDSDRITLIAQQLGA